MTNKSRLISMLGFTPDANAILGVLEDNGLDETDSYVISNYYKIRLGTIALLEIILSTPDITNQITGYSIHYDRAALERRLYRLKIEAGLLFEAQIRAINKW